MNEEYGNDFVTLTDDEGTEYEFEILKEIEFEGCMYAALLPVVGDDEEEPEEIYIVKIVEEDGEEAYEVIEDDSEYEKVAALFEEAFEEDWSEEE